MINQEQTKIIRDYLLGEGFTHMDLLDDLADHISCKIEMLLTDSDISFENAFLIARQEVMPDYALQIEDDLKFLTTKKQNTMIKKLAFIGGYASAVCLCLSILFFTLSSYSSKKSALKISAVQAEYFATNSSGDSWGQSKESNDLRSFNSLELIKSYKNFMLAEKLFISGFILLIGTFLPYQFFIRYQKSEPHFQNA